MRLLLLLVLSLAVLGQNPNTAVFPGRAATDNDLPVATNDPTNTGTTLNGAIDNQVATTTVVLANATKFVAPVIITVESEKMLCLNRSGNTLSNCTRAWGGTTIASHANNTTVHAYLDAYHINQLNAEVKAAETALISIGTSAHTQNTDTGTSQTCFQLAAGVKVCSDGSNGVVFKTAADVVIASISSAGVLTLGDGTAPWNLTGLTDDTPPSAPTGDNQFTTYFDRSDGLFKYILNGGTTQVLAKTTDIPAASSTNPAASGTAAPGVGTTWARADHVHPKSTITLPYGCAVGDPAGSALSTGVLCYITVPTAGTIVGWDVIVDGGTATVDVWKVATGTAKPAVANTITASAKPAIASGTAIHSTTLTGWTTAVAANDILGFNLDAVATAKYITVNIQVVH